MVGLDYEKDFRDSGSGFVVILIIEVILNVYKKSNEKNAKADFSKKTTLEKINLEPKQIKFLINIKNENN